MTTAIEAARANLAAAQLADERAYNALCCLRPNARATDEGNALANQVLDESIRTSEALRFAEWALYEAEEAAR